MLKAPHDRPHAVVVDDNVFIRMEVASILEDADFIPILAADGEEAVRFLGVHHRSVQLRFTDVQMPGSLDGFAVARHTATTWPHIGIVVASGQAKPTPGDMPAGAVFIAKPFSAEIVHEHVRKVLAEDQRPEPLKE